MASGSVLIRRPPELLSPSARSVAPVHRLGGVFARRPDVSQWPPPFWALADRKDCGCREDECSGESVEYITECVSKSDVNLSYDEALRQSRRYFKKGSYTADDYKRDDPEGYAEMVAKFEKWLWSHPSHIPECSNPLCECVWMALEISDGMAFPKKQPNGQYCVAFAFEGHLEGTCMDPGGACH